MSFPSPIGGYSALEQAAYEKLPVLHTLSRGSIYSQHEVRALAFTALKAAMKPFEMQFKLHLQQMKHKKKSVGEGEGRRSAHEYECECPPVLL